MTFKISDASKFHDYNCSTCLEPFSEGTNVAYHENGGSLHPIHPDCLLKSVESAIAQPCKPFCPSCRCAIVKIDNVDLDNLMPSSEMMRIRHRTVVLTIQKVAKMLNLRASSVVIEKMLENRLHITSYLAKTPRGMEIIKCTPDPTKKFGNYGYLISLELK